MVEPGEQPPRRAYQPALDGVRGLSVAMVLLFHGGFTWMTGGYVGVSVFFTLSGFLITGLLLAEHHATGRISASRFYARRVRRLMPASLMCLTVVSVAAAFGEFGGLPHVRRDILAALLQVANWNALANGTSYADLIARSAGQLGPVDHFWSLSVEEQFYWVWPVVCLAVLAGRRSLRTVRTTIVAMAVVAVAAAPLIARVWGPDAAYWATPARLGEILVGAALAAAMTGRRWTWRGLPWLGAAGLAVIAFAAITWPADRGPAYSGWLGLFALASAALIAGLQVPGPLRRMCSTAPLVHLGTISYGVYLYHWPVFAMLTERRTGMEGWSLFAVRVATTLLVAVASFRLLEQPIRNGRAPGRRVAFGTAGAIAMVGVVALVVVPAPPPAFSGQTDVPATFAPATVAPATVAPATVAPATVAPSTVVATTVATPATTAVPAGPVKVLLLGDSTAVALGNGLFDWANERPAEVQLASLARLGCGVVRSSAMFGDDDGTYQQNCNHAYDVELPALLAVEVPSVVVVMVTIPDVVQRVWSADEGPLLPSDQRYAQSLGVDYEHLAETLVQAGVQHVLWVVPPPPNAKWPRSKVDPILQADWSVLVGTIDAVGRRHPEVIDVLRLDQWMATEGDDFAMRSDGLHLDQAAAREVTDRYLGPLLLQLG